MWELGYKENWAPKNWRFWTVVLEKTLESPLDWKEIKPVSLEGNQSWIFIGRTDAEAETNSLATCCKELTHWKRPDAGKDWRQEVKGTTEDEMAGWHHWLDGYVILCQIFRKRGQYSVQFSHSVVSDSLRPHESQRARPPCPSTQSSPTLCNHMDCSTPGLPVHHQLPELAQTHVHWVIDAIQPSHPLSSPSPPAFNLS